MISKKVLINPVNYFILFIVGVSIFNCTPEEEIIDLDYANGLEFSSDTILFDTIFTGVGSTTKRLIVFNPNQKALKISSIKLGSNKSSSFKILVNGTEANQSEELLLLGKDSVLILIEAMINPLK